MIRKLVFALLMTLCTRLSTPAPIVPTKLAAKPVQGYSKDSVCLAWVLNDESRGEPLRGQRAVYDVVKHRMVVRNMTACEVVKEWHQFSGYRPGMRLYTNRAMMQRLEAVKQMKPVVPNADYFHATYVKPSWAARMKHKLKIGLHIFYWQSKPKEKHK